MRHTIKLLLFVYCLLALSDLLKAQVTYSARIMSEDQQPVEYATVVLLDKDSLAICVGVSDREGIFSLSADYAELLRISHLSYKDTLIPLSSPLPVIIYLEERKHEIGEVVIRADKPIMKIIEGGIPSYDIDALFKNSIATNAYEMLMKLPGIIDNGGTPLLVGTSSLTIVINGRNLNIPLSQVLSLLRQIPIQAVQNAEVSYNPIPKYRAEGGSVNIVLKHQATGEEGSSVFAAEVGSFYEQKHYGNGGANAYLSLGKKRVSFRGSYEFELHNTLDDLSIKTNKVDNSLETPLFSKTEGNSRYQLHQALFNLTYSVPKHEVSLDYLTKVIPRSISNQKTIENDYEPLRYSEVDNQMHHFSLDYSWNSAFRVGAFYTIYRNNSDTEVTIPPSTQMNFQSGYHSLSHQRNDVWGGYLQNEHSLSKGWQVNYGLHVTHSMTDDDITYSRNKGIYDLENRAGSYEEFALNGYAGVKKQLNEKLNLSLAVVGNYIDYKKDKKKYITPQLQMTYMMSPGTLLQLAFDSKEVQPAYWERQPFEEHKSAYQMWQGNPLLRPYTTFNSRIVYMLRGKYIFQLSDSYSPRYFMQLMHHDRKAGKLVFKTQNWDYHNTLELTSVVPFSFWQPLSSTLIISANLQSAKGNLDNGISFNRHKVLFYSDIKNELKLWKGTSFDLSLSYITGGIQGYYDMSDMLNLSTGVKWVSKDGKWTIALRGSDLLNRQIPTISARCQSQSFEFEPPKDSRSLLLQVRYSFGKVSKTSASQLETSRF